MANFEFVRPPPWIGIGEREIIFNKVEVRDIERDEAKRLVAIEQLIPPIGDNF